MFLCQVKVVFWKNLILRRRHWFITTCEVAIPVCLFFLVAYARSKIGSLGKIVVPEPTYAEQHGTQYVYDDRNADLCLYYVPRTEFTTELLERSRNKLSILYEDTKGFANESEALRSYAKESQNKTIVLIVFHGIADGSTPTNLNYDVRSGDDGLRGKRKELFYPLHRYEPERGTSRYRKLLPVQLALDTAFVELSTKEKTLPVTLTFQEFPFPPHTDDLGVSDLFNYYLPFITIFSFILLCPALLKRVVEEKFSGIRELMKMAGLKSWTLWCGWFVHAFAANVLSVAIIVVLMKCPLFDAEFPPIERCSATVYAVFLLLYCAACIGFCFAISALFDRPTIAMIAGLLLWILSYFVPKAVAEQYPDMSWCRKMLFAVFPNMALHYGYEALAVYEEREIGLRWDNVGSSASGDANDVSMGNVFVMLLFDFVFYVSVAFYVDGVKPGPYGLPKPWHFPLSELYSLFKKKTVQVSDEAVVGTYEDRPLNLKPGIKIRNLHKKYGKVEAVRGVSLDIYRDQITVLLGHNGAGKSTTMSMITGLITPTNGTVSVDRNGKTLGLCPQHNLVFLDLTVTEHLLFFAMLKGKRLSDAKREADGLLRRLNLHDKRDALPGSLSGGTRRKLCLGMAIVGDSEVLILDEPTTGMDPEARRSVWDLLLSYRTSRTILITTHFMEEADVLGDRIAIMSRGRIDCYGTPMFLKNKFGSGYNLTVVRNIRLYAAYSDDSPEEELRAKQLADIERVIRRVVPEATTKAASGNVVTFLLPTERKPLFCEVLSDLETNKATLGIENISVSITTLEDVFLRVGHDTSDGGKGDDSSSRNSFHFTPRKLESCSFSLRVQALLLKRAYVFVRMSRIHFVQFATALFVTLLTLHLGEGTSSSASGREAPTDVDLSIYGGSTAYYGQDDAFPLSKIGQFYAETAEGQRGDAIRTESVSNSLVRQGVENIARYKRRLVVAAEFNGSSPDGPRINVMYSNFAVHGVAISLNLAMNALLKTTLGEDYSIFTRNVPVAPYADGAESRAEVSAVEVTILWVILFPLGVLFLTGGCMIFPQLERTSNVVRLQFMSGIRAHVYWSTTYCFDLVLYTFAVVVLLFVAFLYSHFVCDVRIFAELNELGTLFAILMAYAIAALPYTYLYGYKKSLAGAFAVYLITGLFAGVVLTVIVVVMQLSGDAYYEKLGDRLRHVFLLFPQFGLAYVLTKFTRKAVENYKWNGMSTVERNRMCHFRPNPCCTGDERSCAAYRSYFRGNDLAFGDELLEMMASAAVYFVILLLLETNYLHRLWDKILLLYEQVADLRGDSYNIPYANSDHQDDKEVLLEANNLEKMYGTRRVVDGVNFKVKAGDCFGLLGVNGAGKTTTFRMLTGDETLTRGTAKIRERRQQVFEITDKPAEYLRRMGYCPQFDALNCVLTGRQTLQIFARLRGIPKPEIEREVSGLLDLLGLTRYADRPCGEYSGGNKRKLSIAIALIGEPPLLLLDEPTSGVDPASRRRMWDIITHLRESNADTSVILTSHSMEECEALCNSLAIMKNGKIKCKGTIPQLKEEYGKGYSVLLKLKYAQNEGELERVVVDEVDGQTATRPEAEMVATTQVDAVMRRMDELYGSQCHLRDSHKGLLHYHITDAERRWSGLFREIESLKTQHPVIEDYTISDASLEDVFLEIAKM